MIVTVNVQGADHHSTSATQLRSVAGITVRLDASVENRTGDADRGSVGLDDAPFPCLLRGARETGTSELGLRDMSARTTSVTGDRSIASVEKMAQET